MAPHEPDASVPTTALTARPCLTLLPPSLRPLASPTFSDSSFRSVSMSRNVTDSGRGHTLMGRTWNTATTIPALISFFRANASATDPNPETRLEVRRFYVFGADLNAHPDLLHGGVISCILDSSLGGAVGVAMSALAAAAAASASAGERGRVKEVGLGVDGGEKDHGDSVTAPMYTVQLNVRYRRPVKTPGGVMVRSWVKKVEEGGRKVWAEGVVEGIGGLVHAEAEGLWLRGKAKL